MLDFSAGLKHMWNYGLINQQILSNYQKSQGMTLLL